MTVASWIGIVALVVAALFIITVGLFRWLYVKVPANLAFVRTGLGGRKVVLSSGAFVLPIVHNLQWLSLETFKIEIERANRDAFITKDRYRVDMGSEFYVKIAPDPALIEAASRSLGEKSFSADGIKALVEEKLVSAMRSGAAETELVELHENRRAFALRVKDIVSEPLEQNGLMVEDVALFTLDQTDRNQLDPNNIFDAQGLRQITAETSVRMRERNDIERNTEVEIKRKDVEAVQMKLDLDRDQQMAEAAQVRAIETHATEQRAETERIKFQQEQQIRESELAKDVYLTEKERDRELVAIEREQAVEAAQRTKAIVVLQEERKRIVEEESRLRADAQREEAEQAVATAAQRAGAERAKEVALIQALNELDVADRKAQATERLAQAKLRDGEVDAQVVELLRRAENAIEEKLVYRDVAVKLIERAPEIARELMEPSRHIDSIRILDVKGLGGDGNGEAGPQDPIGRVYQAMIGTGAALPLIKELLSFAQKSGLADQLEEALPGLKNVVELRQAGDTS